MHKGICVGGPMAGETITTRSDTGFVAVDTAGSAVWVYRTTGDGSFQVDLSPDASLLDDDGTRALDPQRITSATEQHGLDVVALTGVDDEPAAEAPAIDDSADAEGGGC